MMHTILAKWILPIAVGAVVIPAAVAQKAVEQELDSSSQPTVSVEIDSGELTVEVWQRDSVRIEGTIADSVDEFEVRKRSDNAIDIRIEDKRSGDYQSSGNSGTKLQLFLPVASTFNLESINASVVLSGLQGDIDIESVNGSVEVTDITGHVELETVNGSIEAVNIAGNVEVESVNGTVELEQTAGNTLELGTVNGTLEVISSASDIDLESVSGSTRLQLKQVKRLSAETVSGDLKGVLQLQRHGDLSVDSVSGGIRLTLVEPLNIDVAVESMSGFIRNRITDDEVVKGRFGLGRSLEFNAGDASAEVRINTLSGRVELESGDD